jgi:hypothetical protein
MVVFTKKAERFPKIEEDAALCYLLFWDYLSTENSAQ